MTSTYFTLVFREAGHRAGLSRQPQVQEPSAEDLGQPQFILFRNRSRQLITHTSWLMWLYNEIFWGRRSPHLEVLRVTPGSELRITLGGVQGTL